MINLKNNKAQLQIQLTGGGVLVILIILMILFIILGIFYVIYLQIQEYEKQIEYGDSLLNNLTLSTSYIEPIKGSTLGIISAEINTSIFKWKSTEIIPTYTAYNFDKTKSVQIYDGKKIFLTSPSNLPNKEIETSNIYSKLGNEAQVCITIKITYTDTNWISWFKDNPKKTLGNCKNLITNFE